jgi:mevalonate kinase
MYAMIYCLCQPFAISLEHFIEDGLGSSAVVAIALAKGTAFRFSTIATTIKWETWKNLYFQSCTALI